jgi:hypothetical protein
MPLLIPMFFWLLISGSDGSPIVSHQTWNELLYKNVTASGKVSYKGFKTDEEKLNSYLAMLASNVAQANWSRHEQMAYWINTYNAFTIKLILDHYPVKSIMDIESGKAWDKPFILLQNRKYTLNQIEHEILRAKFDDPRIHFAVNCAAISCPRLLNEAYTAEKLDRQLTAQARSFINDRAFNKISSSAVSVSQIFDWYNSDFTKMGTLIDYLNNYSAVKIEAGAGITYLTYNWNLHEMYGQ